jgi:hypothetical protein
MHTQTKKKKIDWCLTPTLTSVSSPNKTDCHNITEILLKVGLNTIKQTNNLSAIWRNCLSLIFVLQLYFFSFFVVVDVICENLPDTYVDKLLNYLSGGIEFTAHVEFYVRWINKLLMCHGPKLKQRSQKIMTTLRTLQKNVTRKYEDIGKL